MNFGFSCIVQCALLNITILGSLSADAHAATIYYVDSLNGNDTLDGTSESTPWRSLDRVNAASLESGDSVLFKRGGQWRGTLTAKKGSGTAKIIYGAYGTGAKPLLLGSVSLKSELDWNPSAPGSHVWVSQYPSSIGSNLITWSGQYSIAASGVPIAEFVPADTQEHSASSQSSLKINFSGQQGTSKYDVQIFNAISSLIKGKYYKLTFNAKANQDTVTPAIRIIRNAADYDQFADTVIGAAPTIGTAWQTFEVYFRSTADTSNARVNFELGTTAKNTVINMDSFKLTETDGSKILAADVGNLIFDEMQALVGRKVLAEADMRLEGDFWYDSNLKKIKLYSQDNPASTYPQVEAALTRHIITMTGNVTLQNLDLRYGGAHGVSATSGSKQVLIDGLDMSFIGGGLLTPDTRYGNGVQFWLSAEDTLVRNSQFNQIYDVAMTVQGVDATQIATVRNVSFLNNYVTNSEQCFELWNRGAAGSSTDGVTFSKNTCIGSGRGWAHAQRPDPRGSDLLFYSSPRPMTNIRMSENIFYNSVTNLVYLDMPWQGYQSIDLSKNCFYPAPQPGPGQGLLLWQRQATTATTFVATADPDTFIGVFASAAKPASVYTDPQLLSFPGGVLMPAAGGPCQDRGYNPAP